MRELEMWALIRDDRIGLLTESLDCRLVIHGAAGGVRHSTLKVAGETVNVRLRTWER